MEKSIKTGISFGLTSGTITTIGLMTGLFSGTHSKSVVIGGLITIAIADSMSDALGIHISQESNKLPKKAVFKSTFSSFFAKLFYTLTFIIPLLLFSLEQAIIISIVYGMCILSLLSYYISKENKESSFYVIFEHLIIALIVIFLTYFIGKLIPILFHL